jgi:hypothetical protein
LFADYGGLELHGAILSPARRSPERHMEIPKWAARELTSIADLTMPAIVKSFANLGLLPANIHFEKFVPASEALAV